MKLIYVYTDPMTDYSDNYCEIITAINVRNHLDECIGNTADKFPFHLISLSDVIKKYKNK